MHARLAALFIAGTLLISCQGGEPKPGPTPAPPSPRVETAWIIYAHLLGEERTLYRARIDGSDRTSIAAPVPIRVYYDPSPSGRYVTRFDADANRLEVAPVGNLRAFRLVAQETKRLGWMAAPTWSEDESLFAYLVVRPFKPRDPHSLQLNRLYVVRRNGTGRRLVKTFRDPPFPVLRGVSATRKEIYITQTGWDGGGEANLRIIDLSSGRIKASRPRFFTEGGAVVAHRSPKMYYISDSRTIVEHGLDDGRERVVYRARTRRASIRSLVLSADERLLVFSVIVGRSYVTRSIDLSSRSLEVLLRDKRYAGLLASELSPDGRYLFFVNNCGGCGNEGESWIMDVWTGRMILFHQRTRGRSEWIFPVAWFPEPTGRPA